MGPVPDLVQLDLVRSLMLSTLLSTVNIFVFQSPFVTYTEEHNPWVYMQTGQSTDHLYRRSFS
jgi:hypothetical protein